jgi:predicted MPP superfamily phosphohydrolase
VSEAAASAPVSRPRRLRRYAVRTLIVAALYFGILVYPVLRLAGLLLPDWTPGTPELLALMVLPLAFRITYERWPNAFTRRLAAVALTWLGICFQLFALVFVFEIGNLLFALPPLAAGYAILTTIVLLTVAGFVNAQMLTVRRVPITAPAAAASHRIAQISDVHIGSRSPALLERIVAKVNAARPDYVVITGDLIDFAGISRQELAPLGAFNAPAFFAIGNHERYVDLAAIDERLRSLGVRVLRDEAELHGPFQFIGIDDVDDPDELPERLAGVDLSPDHYGVLLYHRPDGFEAAAERSIPLMLAGHTHAGQIIPFNLIVKRVFPRIRGLYDLNGSRLYVSPGTGTWGPVLRIGSRSEITLFEFVTDNAPTAPAR